MPCQWADANRSAGIKAPAIENSGKCVRFSSQLPCGRLDWRTELSNFIIRMHCQWADASRSAGIKAPAIEHRLPIHLSSRISPLQPLLSSLLSSTQTSSIMRFSIALLAVVVSAVAVFASPVPENSGTHSVYSHLSYRVQADFTLLSQPDASTNEVYIHLSIHPDLVTP